MLTIIILSYTNIITNLSLIQFDLYTLQSMQLAKVLDTKRIKTIKTMEASSCLEIKYYKIIISTLIVYDIS